MVWHGTTHVGIAAAQAESGRTFVVARYWPAGNRIGEEPYPDEGLKRLREDAQKVRERRVGLPSCAVQ